MVYEFVPKGVCAQKIKFKVNDGIVSDVEFVAGCNGNGKAIGALCEGLTVEEISNRLSNIKCGSKNTSCADQLTKAFKLID